MERSVWTDERITDMVVRVDKSIDSLRDEVHDLRAEMHDGFARMDDGFQSLRREMLHVVLVMSGMLVTVLVTVLAKSF